MAGVTEFNSSQGNLISKIKKRDGRIVSFEQSKISNAIYKALVATGKPDYRPTERLVVKAEDVRDMVETLCKQQKACAICGMPLCRKLNGIFCYTCGVDFG